MAGQACWREGFHYLRPNSKDGSRRNIADHYDLGNAFYSEWLDNSMTYSSAVFEGSNSDDLYAAQQENTSASPKRHRCSRAIKCSRLAAAGAGLRSTP